MTLSQVTDRSRKLKDSLQQNNIETVLSMLSLPSEQSSGDLCSVTMPC